MPVAVRMTPTSRPIVLIVQADPHTCLLLRRGIELEGCKARVASSIPDAYRVLAKHSDRVALLVLDITTNLPDIIALRQFQLDAARIAGIAAVVVSDRPLTDDERALLRPTGILMKRLHFDGATVPVAGHSSGENDRGTLTRDCPRSASRYRFH